MTQEHKDFFIFARKCLVLMLCLGSVAVAVSIAGYHGNSYARGFSLKQSLLNNTPSPRLIIVGGSGSSFGIDSSILQRKTKLHTINTGMYAGYGMRFLDETVSPHVRADDVIIIIPEYEILHQPPWGDGYTFLETALESPSSIQYMGNYHSIVNMIRAFPIWWKDKAMVAYRNLFGDPGDHPIYRFTNIQLSGDLVALEQQGSVLTEEGVRLASIEFVRPHANHDSLAILKEFVSKAEMAGATVFLSWAPLSDRTYDVNKESVESRKKEMLESFDPKIFLGTPEQFIYPTNYFYDALTHLNDRGREARTKLIADMISKKL